MYTTKRKPMPKEFPGVRFKESARRAARMHKLAADYGAYGRPLVNEAFASLVDAVRDAIPGAPDKEAVAASCTPVLGMVGDRRTLDPLFNRLATCADALAAGQSVGAFDPDGYATELDGWTALEFVDLIPVNDEDGDLCLEFALCVVAGPAWGMRVRHAYRANDPAVDALMYYTGCADRRSTRLPRELVQMRIWAEAYTRRGVWTYGRWQVDKSLRTWNGGIIRARRGPCPREFQHPCAQCPIGRDACEKAVRPISILTNGGRLGILHDPGQHSIGRDGHGESQR